MNTLKPSEFAKRIGVCLSLIHICHAGCHATCAEYLSEKKAHDELREN